MDHSRRHQVRIGQDYEGVGPKKVLFLCCIEVIINNYTTSDRSSTRVFAVLSYCRYCDAFGGVIRLLKQAIAVSLCACPLQEQPSVSHAGNGSFGPSI